MAQKHKLVTHKEITRVRRSFGYSLPKFASALDIPMATLKAWEAGERKPTVLASKVFRLLSKDPKWLRVFEEV